MLDALAAQVVLKRPGVAVIPQAWRNVCGCTGYENLAQPSRAILR